MHYISFYISSVSSIFFFVSSCLCFVLTILFVSVFGRVGFSHVGRRVYYICVWCGLILLVNCFPGFLSFLGCVE